MNPQDQIDYLNEVVVIRIAPSKIHGIGIVALRNLSKGKRLHLDDLPRMYRIPYANFGKLFKEIRQLLVEEWPRTTNNEPFAYPIARYQAFVNHSDSPNYDGITDTLLQDVKEGEEITEDYRLIAGWEKAYPFLTNNK